MTHRYSELVTLNTGASGSLFGYLFSVNGMWDPNTTGTGHQPLFFDQMTAIYNHYTVIGSKLTVKLFPFNTTQAPMQIVLFLDDDTTLSPTNVDGLNEQNRTKLRMLPAGMNTPTTISLKWSAKRIFGKGLMSNNALQGSATANPSEQQYFRIAYCSPSATSTSWYAQCTIEYIALWHERHDVPTS